MYAFALQPDTRREANKKLSVRFECKDTYSSAEPTGFVLFVVYTVIFLISRCLRCYILTL